MSSNAAPTAATAAAAAIAQLAATATILTIIPAGAVRAVQERGPEEPDAAVVVAWNRLGYEIAYAEDEFLTFKGQRALAMMNLAMHDAINTIEPVFDRYAHTGDEQRADPEAAAAWAAFAVLRAQYPGSTSRLDSLLARHSLPGGTEAARSARALGRAVAETILAERRNDDWDAPGTYAYAKGAGRYQTTPDWNGFVLQPGFREAHPFAIESIDEFRPEPPPAVADSAYTRAYQEVKAHGAMQSPVRTPDQTGYAVWWMEFSEGSVNRLARRLVMERGVGLRAAARLFAHLHVALHDAYIVTWDSKYEYDHWRPFTAIRSAAQDGNPGTASDADWVSLLPAPPFPEYVSAHAAGCAAAFTVMASVFGDEAPFMMTTITAPEGMPERSFSSFADAAAECADSRVQLGWHFRYSTDAGLALGKRVANHVLRMRLRSKAESDRRQPSHPQ